MGIAKHIQGLKPGEARWNDEGTYAISHHNNPDTGVGGYGWTTGNGASGGVPYGGSLPTQRDAMATVAKRIRGVMNNRTKDQRRNSGGNGTQGEPGLTSL
jgi:hypothetical protein